LLIRALRFPSGKMAMALRLEVAVVGRGEEIKRRKTRGRRGRIR
jgi:hypothetical protein